MNKQTISSHLNTGNEETFSPEDRDKFLTQLEIINLVYILKEFSSKEQPISAGKIAVHMKNLTYGNHSPKTILRKLQKLMILQNDPKEEAITNALRQTLGGLAAEESNAQNQNIVKKQSRFYFEPLLDESDISLICGAVTSNRYLSEEEKNYLIARIKTLSVKSTNLHKAATQEQEQRLYTVVLPEKPARVNADSTMPANLLHHVNQLHDAIRKGYMVQLQYGVFDLNPKKLWQILFRTKNAQNPYILNPYALLWNGGAYYLLATHKGHTNPVHFRVDRITGLKPLVTKSDATVKEPREPLPESLHPFFPSYQEGNMKFESELYTSRYPLMGIYNDSDLIDCGIECTEATLSILIDSFGSSLHILPSLLSHTKEELTDFHGNPQRYFTVKIKQVQYDNILQFCLQQHASVTALYPQELVSDVSAGLKKALQKYEHVLQTKTSLNPFTKTSAR